MNAEIYGWLTQPLWLEDAPTFIEDEYWVPQEESIDWYIYDHPECLEELKKIDLIFDPWEINQQEEYVGGIGNKELEKVVVDASIIGKAMKQYNRIVGKKKILLVSDDFINTSQIATMGGIEYTPSTYKYIRRKNE